MIEAGGDPANEADALRSRARDRSVAAPSDPAIRTDEIGAGRLASSPLFPAVRAALLAFQRKFAAHPPEAAGAVIDGRDIGTVVCPDATAKLFVDATPEVRARRRWLELKAVRHSPGEADVLADIHRARRPRPRARPSRPSSRPPTPSCLIPRIWI